MGEVSITILGMELEIRELEIAIRSVGDAADRVRRNLDDVWLSSPSLYVWSPNGAGTDRLRVLRDRARDRLEMAKKVAAMRPTMRTVVFDSSVFLDQAAQQTVDMINGWLRDGRSTDVPQELVDMILAHGDDPEFAADLLAKGGLDAVVAFLDLCNTRREKVAFDVTNGVRPQTDLDQFDRTYALMLDSLGTSFSEAAQDMNPDQLYALTQQFKDKITSTAGKTTPAVVSLLISRGAWPDEFLTGVTDAILDVGNATSDYWGAGGQRVVVDPLADDTGVKHVVSDPMYGVFRSSALYNPGWMLDYFTGGGVTIVDLPGYDYPDGKHADAQSCEVDSRLHDLITRYGLDEGSAYWFSQAANNAAVWEVQTRGTTEFGTDVTTLIEKFEREDLIHDHKSWWDKYKHQVLMGLAGALAITTVFVAPYVSGWVVTAMVAADVGLGVADAIEYFKDEEYTAAWLTLAFSLIPVVVGGVIKFIRLSRAEIDMIQSGGTLAREGVIIDDVILTEGEAIAQNLGKGKITIKAVKGKIQWVINADNVSEELLKAAQNREQAIAAANAAKKDFNDALAELNQALKDAGKPPVTAKDFNAENIDKTIRRLQSECGDDFDLIDKINDMQAAGWTRQRALAAQGKAGEEFGELASKELSGMYHETALIDDASPGSGTVDQAWVSQDRKTVYVVECKAPSAGLGTRQVPTDTGVVTAQQGTTEYLRDIIRQDTRLRDAILADPELHKGLLDGTVELKYRLVRPNPAGGVSERYFTISVKDLDLLDWLGPVG